MENKTKIKLNWFTVALLVGFWLLCASFYPSLPEQVPSHWNFQGEVDGYSSKTTAAFFMPLLPLGIYLFMTFLPRFDPKRENYGKFSMPYEKIRLATVLLLAVFTAMPILVSLGYDINIGLIARIAIPLLLMIIGNYMGKIRFNYFTGIRTPWTLASEAVWNQTHRFGGRMMVIGGLFALLSIFLSPTYGFYVVLGGILVPPLTAVIYSYILFQRLAK